MAKKHTLHLQGPECKCCFLFMDQIALFYGSHHSYTTLVHNFFCAKLAIALLSEATVSKT